MVNKKLLVILSGRLSELAQKGEMTDRYYNPGNLFKEVEILLVNDDKVNPADIQRMVGDAKLSIVNLPRPSFSKSMGWQKPFLKQWVANGIDLARKSKADLMRVHGNFENGYLAAQIKKALNIPYVVSLHINPDENMRGPGSWFPFWKDRLLFERQKFFERETLENADMTLPVYEPIREYAEKYGAKTIKVCYNVLNPSHLRKKESYQLQNPPHFVSVGRQIPDKNPEHIIRAVARLNAKYTLFGDGSHHNYLKKVAQEQKSGQFEFIPALSNDELCRRLPEFDVFVTHTQYFEISKSVFEALLTGLPVVLNKRIGKPVKELQGNWCRLVDNTTESYFETLKSLIENNNERETLGRRAYEHSHQHYDPKNTENVYEDIYRSLVPGL